MYFPIDCLWGTQWDWLARRGFLLRLFCSFYRQNFPASSAAHWGLQVSTWMEWGFSNCHWRAQNMFPESIIKTALPQRLSLWSHFLINMGFVIIVSLCWQKCSWWPQAARSWILSQSKHTLWLLLASDDCTFWMGALAASLAIIVIISIYCLTFKNNSSKDIYPVVGPGLAEFRQRRKCKVRCKAAWGRVLYNMGIHDLLDHLSCVLLPELFFRLYGSHDPMSVKQTNRIQSLLAICPTWL